MDTTRLWSPLPKTFGVSQTDYGRRVTRRDLMLARDVARISPEAHCYIFNTAFLPALGRTQTRSRCEL